MESDLVAVSVDDERVNLLLVEQMAQELGIRVRSFQDPLLAVSFVEANPVDLVFVDYMMPGMDGIGFIGKVRGMHADIPIVMITAVTDNDELKLRAIKAGATEFLNKPLNMPEFTARINNLTTLRKAQRFYKDWAILLKKEVEKATEKILLREDETLQVLGKAAEYKDPETGNHILRVARYSRLLVEAAGESEQQQDLILKSSPLHDVGKLGIPEAILCKPGKLTPEEFAVIRRHPEIGHEIIRRSSSPFLLSGSEVALTHHEKWDGSGYPRGLRGEEIPLFGRISAIADVFDALITRRPYKEPWPIARALEYVDGEKGRHFDPRLARLFLESRQRVQEICDGYKDA
jgi:response regulator RpfG family c-di-GMP phosphodiesterase